MASVVFSLFEIISVWWENKKMIDKKKLLGINSHHDYSRSTRRKNRIDFIFPNRSSGVKVNQAWWDNVIR